MILKEFDITKFETHIDFYNSLEPKPLGVIVAAGYMAEQKECENDFTKTLNTINVNFTGAVSILNIVANNMEKSKNGFIVGVSSVAGDRGRKANYIYGSSKAAFSAYLSGLRNRLFESKVQVLTVKPGFVAQQKGKDILYTKSIWKLIMLIIKHIPEWKFKRMSI